MKIVEIISSFYPVGGAQTLVCNLCLKFRPYNDVYVISLYNEKDNFLVKKLQSSGINIIFLNKKKGLDFKTAKALKKVLFAINPDVVHCHLSTYLSIFLSRTMKKFKVLYTFHSVINKGNSGSRFKISNLFVKYLVNSKRMIPIAISNLVKDSLEEFFHFKQIELVPNGVDIDIFSLGNEPKNRDIDFIVIGSFTTIKNQLFILKCFANAQKFNKNFNITFLGEGPLEKECVNFVIENNIPNITFLGLKEETALYLKRSKVLCMASQFEGNPMVINEAIACGTYVLSNDVGGIPDLIISKLVGKLIPFNEQTVKRYSQEMVGIMNKYDKLYKDIKENNRIFAKGVSIENTVELYLELFKKYCC